MAAFGLFYHYGEGFFPLEDRDAEVKLLHLDEVDAYELKREGLFVISPEE